MINVWVAASENADTALLRGQPPGELSYSMSSYFGILSLSPTAATLPSTKIGWLIKLFRTWGSACQAPGSRRESSAQHQGGRVGSFSLTETHRQHGRHRGAVHASPKELVF